MRLLLLSGFCLVLVSSVAAADEAPPQCHRSIAVDGISKTELAYHDRATAFFEATLSSDYVTVGSIEGLTKPDYVILSPFEKHEDGRFYPLGGHILEGDDLVRSAVAAVAFLVQGEPEKSGSWGSLPPSDYGYEGLFFKEWDAEHTAYAVEPVLERLRAMLSREAPFHEKLWDFERIPMTGDIIFEKESLEPDETTTVWVKNLKDRNGRDSGKMYGPLRMLLKAKKGWLRPARDSHLRDVSHDTDAKLKVIMTTGFTRPTDVIKFLYTAPTEEGEVSFELYNSCTTVRESVTPYATTSKGGQIGHATLPIKITPWTGTFTVSRAFSKSKSGTFRSEGGQGSSAYRCSVEVRAHIPLGLEAVTSNPLMTGSLFRSTSAHSGTTLSIVSKEYSELKTRTCTEIHDKQAVCSVPVKWLMVPQLSLLSNHKEYSIALALDQADDCIGKEYSNVCGRERTLEWNAGSSFRFYTQEYVTPFLGPVTDGKALSGSWKNPEPPDENSNCSLGDNSNLTVEWSAARQ